MRMSGRVRIALAGSAGVVLVGMAAFFLMSREGSRDCPELAPIREGQRLLAMVYRDGCEEELIGALSERVGFEVVRPEELPGEDLVLLAVSAGSIGPGQWQFPMIDYGSKAFRGNWEAEGLRLTIEQARSSSAAPPEGSRVIDIGVTGAVASTSQSTERRQPIWCPARISA